MLRFISPKKHGTQDSGGKKLGTIGLLSQNFKF